jgi:hypothetical protein
MRTLTLATISCALFIALSIASGAEAQDRARPGGERETHYSFTDELVRGDMVRPDGVLLHARRRRGSDTLIRVRENFIAELYKSIENI